MVTVSYTHLDVYKRQEHLYEVGKRIRLKGDIKLLYQILERGVDGYAFDFYVLSAAPVEVIHSALEGIVPQDHIYGTEFRYKPSGEIDSIVRATAGYGKVAVLNQLLAEHITGPDHVIYSGDGSSDIPVSYTHLFHCRQKYRELTYYFGRLREFSKGGQAASAASG